MALSNPPSSFRSVCPGRLATRLRRGAAGACGVAAILLWLGACDVSGTGVGLNLVPEQQIEQAGQEAWTQIRADNATSTNAAYRQRTSEVAQRILKAAGHDPAEWDVVVFRGDQINAFALPNKKIGVYEGMLGVADTPAKLAAVIGHEVAHVEEKHAAERMNTEVVTQLGVQAAATGAGLAGLGDPQLLAQVLGVGAQYGVALPYSRNQELEADRLGLQVMAEAGYNPQAAIELWQSLSSGPRQPAFLATHPNPERRIEQLQANMDAAMKTYRAAR